MKKLSAFISRFFVIFLFIHYSHFGLLNWQLWLFCLVLVIFEIIVNEESQ